VSIKTTSDFNPDDFANEVFATAARATEEQFAEGLAERARELGLDSTETIALNIEIEGDPEGQIVVDERRVHALADAILGGGGPRAAVEGPVKT
jgi:hypothetical protein